MQNIYADLDGFYEKLLANISVIKRGKRASKARARIQDSKWNQSDKELNRIRRRGRKNTGAWTDESGRARACRGGRSLLQVGEGPSDFVNSPRGRRFAGVWAFGTDSGPVDKSVVLSVVFVV